MSERRIPHLAWGTDGKGRRHFLCDRLGACDRSGKYFGIMTNAEVQDYEKKNCEKCEAGEGKAQDGPRYFEVVK